MSLGRQLCPRPQRGGIRIAQTFAAIAALAMAASVTLPIDGGEARAQSAKHVAKTKTKSKSPPLPSPSPRRMAGTPASGDAAERALNAPLAKIIAVIPPAVPDSAEATYFAAMDRLIAPLRDAAPSGDDVRRLRDALKAIDRHNIVEARAEAAKITEPAARTLIEWYALRSGIGSAAEFKKFLAEEPAWPDARQLTMRAEQQLLSAGGPARGIRAFFAGGTPQSGAGAIALASALMAEGDDAGAKVLAVKAWRENDVSPSQETGFLKRFDRYLQAADHRRRLDTLLIDEGRSASARSVRAAAAGRLLPLLPEAERKKATARIAVYSRSKQATKLMAALPAKGDGQDWGLLYQRIQLARSRGHEEEAAHLLNGAPSDADALVDPDAWWSMRHWAAYEFLGAGKFKEAYDVVRKPGPLTVNPLKDATFLAGWLAHRHLKDAKGALVHYEASRVAADGPLSAARALYWLARAHEDLGQRAEAKRRYEEAATRIDTFHGSLAREKLSPGPHDVPAPLPALPSADVARAFNANPLLRAALLAHYADVGRGLTRIIFAHLRYRLATEPEVALLAHLAFALGDHQMALRVGKTGVARDMNLFVYAYPVHPFPEYTPLRQSPERALLLAIARQESEFNTDIISHAGARGLLQVMPITARHICRDHKIKCDIPRLSSDKSYNAMIASAYIGDRKQEFTGSYVLTLAGYNAGPGRARQWMKRFGDPRKPDVDPIDWIVMIPFDETRDYVKKVLSNLQMYRARLGEPRPVRLVSDLNR